MKSKTKVVVIGGGAVGVSMLYHLAKKGWSDVVLVERKEINLWIDMACSRFITTFQYELLRWSVT